MGNNDSMKRIATMPTLFGINTIETFIGN
jgi:hypothetical protein